MSDFPAVPLTRLDHLGIVCVTGSDARAFLQGQLSLDTTRLTPQRLELASCNSAQGRVQAILWIVERSDGIAMMVPATLVDATIQRLRKYILRAKVKVESAGDRLVAFDAGHGDLGVRTHSESNGFSLIGWPGEPQRRLLLAPLATSAANDAAQQLAWRLADIRAGLPQVYPQTHEMFVAQMLNLDTLEGIHFDKGCYTGQEIIARTHFRGSIKRRMFLFSAACNPPEPATRVVIEGVHAGEVVDAAATGNGCELLAVVNLAQADAALELDAVPGSALHRLELPYGTVA